MDEIQAAVLALLPGNRKQTPSGWISFNSVCCHHRGEKADSRKRGGLHLDSNGSWIYHCFNCGFKAGWRPGQVLTKNARQLFQWMGLPESDLNSLIFLSIKEQTSELKIKKEFGFELQSRELPEQTKSIDQWILEGCQDPELIEVINYITNIRNMDWNWYPWHWSSAPGYRDRVILPFYHQKQIVGWTARKIRDGKPKYLANSQPGYVFNLDSQTDHSHRQFVIAVEGQFDSVAIDGVAFMHNEPNETQCARINALGRQVIVVPDRDRAGAKLIQSALDNGWSVSLPEWGKDVKDVADAVQKYNRLYTLYTILHYRETNEIKIQLLKKSLETGK